VKACLQKNVYLNDQGHNVTKVEKAIHLNDKGHNYHIDSFVSSKDKAFPRKLFIQKGTELTLAQSSNA
jgi:hypothetical protein